MLHLQGERINLQNAMFLKIMSKLLIYLFVTNALLKSSIFSVDFHV